MYPQNHPASSREELCLDASMQECIKKPSSPRIPLLLSCDAGRMGPLFESPEQKYRPKSWIKRRDGAWLCMMGLFGKYKDNATRELRRRTHATYADPAAPGQGSCSG